jgi:NADH-quinone oxidoreductase subunit J
MLATRRAVHSALLLAVTMMCLAVLFGLQGGIFLAVVQVVVYTGAVMMLFLFVLMLVGVDSSDSLVETIRGQRIAAVLAGLGFGILVIAGLGSAAVTGFVGLDNANSGGNVQGLARLVFTRYVFAFELTSALLITAALGAMVLAHRERTEPRKSQRELAEERFRGFREGHPVTMLPPPGTYARHNAVDTPALLPDGTPSELSVSRILRARGDVRTVESARRGGAVVAPEEAVPPEIEAEAALGESSELQKGPTP